MNQLQPDRNMILAWLGQWRDKFPPNAVHDLQDLLGVPREGSEMKQLQQGTPVHCNGYDGAIVRHYGGKMYEIRLPGGVICTDDFTLSCSRKREHEVDREHGIALVEQVTKEIIHRTGATIEDKRIIEKIIGSVLLYNSHQY